MAVVSRETLNNVMDEISDDTELFAILLHSYPDRLKDTNDVNGYYTNY